MSSHLKEWNPIFCKNTIRRWGEISSPLLVNNSKITQHQLTVESDKNIQRIYIAVYVSAQMTAAEALDNGSNRPKHPDGVIGIGFKFFRILR